MKAQFGSAVKGYWVYVDDLCPCCSVHPIDEMEYKGQRTVSINGFMYREKGILIAYLLCGECAKAILAHKKYEKTPMHEAIEANLISAYQRYLSSLDA